MRRAIVVLLGMAALSASGSVNVDPATGLWYPPYASPSEYLRRDPNHSYMKDVQRAFGADPNLEKEVCASVLAVPQPPVDGSTRQLRAMFDMMCIGHGWALRHQAEESDRVLRAATGLDAILQEEERAAASVKAEDRDAEIQSLVNTVASGGQVLRPALRAITLDPSDTIPPAELLRIQYPLTEGTQTYTPRLIAMFIEKLYESRASSDRADARQWKAALPAVLLFLGKLEKAREAATAWQAEAPPERISFARTTAAVIDRVSGTASSIRSTASDCHPSPKWRSANPDAPAADYCLAAATALAVNALRVADKRASTNFAGAAFELADLQRANWPSRLALVEAATHADPAGTQRRLYDMLEQPAIPEGAILDAVYDLAKLAAHYDPANAAPLYDCWLELQGVKIPPLPVDAWTRLAAVPEQPSEGADDCFEGEPADSACVIHALQVREQAAIDARQWDVAHQSVEKLLAFALASKGNPEPARFAICTLVTQEVDAGRKKEAGPAIAYLARQPHDEYITGQLERLKAFARDEGDPWHTPTIVDASHLIQQCPPHRPPKMLAARVNTPQSSKSGLPDALEATAIADSAMNRRYAIAGTSFAAAALLLGYLFLRRRG